MMVVRSSAWMPSLCLVPLLAGSLVGCEELRLPGQFALTEDADPSPPAAADDSEPFDFESVANQAGTPNRPIVPEHTNRLAKSNSPYLLLHAHNPVDWYPWGPEALEKAKRENKPIFLSVGYSSCHWCHVMERKVFSDVEIAAYLNKHFVCVKVDREERPDVDRVYMTGLLTYLRAVESDQGGGWPLSLFLTPDGKPFLGGTYFPPERKEGRPGFPDVAERVVTLWSEKTDAVTEFANLLVGQMRRTLSPTLALAKVESNRELSDAAAEALLLSFDDQHGGFGFDARRPDNPKFPVGSRLALLQYRVRRFGDKRAEAALRTTLDAMASGGLYDHLAGGFHRYSTDRQWRVPHFEKMLYDQAQLAEVYTEAYRIDHRAADRIVAEGICDFTLAHLRNPKGGFLSALDAESGGGVEGAYYVWSRDEIERLLGPEQWTLFATAYDIEGEPELEAGHVLHRPRSTESLASAMGGSAAAIESRLAESRSELLTERSRRQPPRTDDKILTAWNGLMIGSLSRAGRVLGRDEYTRAAAEGAMFVLTHLRDERGRLLRSHREGTSAHVAYLDDYAYLVQGLLALHETTRDDKWFNAARRLTDEQLELFWDERGKGFFYTARDGEELVVPIKLAFDDALPAANAVAVRNLIRIASISGIRDYRDRASETLAAFAADLERAPVGTSTLALALGEYLDNPNFGANLTPRSRETGLAQPSRYQRSPSNRESDIQLVSAELLDEEDAPKPEDSAAAKKDEILAARAFLEYDKLPAGGKCRILFQLQVAKGWHVNANPPQPDYMKPVEVVVTSKNGVKLASAQYPKGKKYVDEGLDETISIYEGSIVVRGELAIPAAAAGKVEELQLVVKYQPCRDGRCLRPTQLELKGRIPVVPASQAKPVNTKHFPKKKPVELPID